MASEPLHVPSPAPAPGTGWTAPASDWPDVATREVSRHRVDDFLIEVAGDLTPGKALDLGCGEGREGIWLAQHGWMVHGVDGSAGAIETARTECQAVGATVVLEVADIGEWRPSSRYDLVSCLFALPARGNGRSRVLEMAAAAVAPGGTIVLADLDISLRTEGWMAEKYLVSTDELERHLDGFRIHRSGVRMARRRQGYEARILPAAHVVATRRTDLRTPF